MSKKVKMSKKANKHADDTHRMRCPHCGHILWNRRPVLRETYEATGEMETVTSQAVAAAMDLSLSNAMNRLRQLEEVGAVREAERKAMSSGGYQLVFERVDGLGPSHRTESQ